MRPPQPRAFGHRPHDGGRAHPGTRRWLGCLLLLSLGGCERGCSTRVDYADTPDLASAKEAFACSSPASPSAEEACATIEAFALAGPLTSYADSERSLFLGRSRCAKDEGESVVFELATLTPDESPFPADEEHRPGGTFAVSMRVFSRTSPLHNRADLDRAAEDTIRALQTGAPSLGLALPEDHFFPRTFAAWRAGVEQALPTPHPTALSDGVSLLDGPGSIGAWWDDFDRAPTLHFVRQAEDGTLIRLMPTDAMSIEPRGQSCVTRFYPLPK